MNMNRLSLKFWLLTFILSLKELVSAICSCRDKKKTEYEKPSTVLLIVNIQITQKNKRQRRLASKLLPTC